MFPNLFDNFSVLHKKCLDEKIFMECLKYIYYSKWLIPIKVALILLKRNLNVYLYIKVLLIYNYCLCLHLDFRKTSTHHFNEDLSFHSKKTTCTSIRQKEIFL